jgi:hypothetical protein
MRRFCREFRGASGNPRSRKSFAICGSSQEFWHVAASAWQNLRRLSRRERPARRGGSRNSCKRHRCRRKKAGVRGGRTHALLPRPQRVSGRRQRERPHPGRKATARERLRRATVRVSSRVKPAASAALSRIRICHAASATRGSADRAALRRRAPRTGSRKAADVQHLTIVRELLGRSRRGRFGHDPG